VNTATGLISGVATVSGTSDVTISATNAGGTGSATLVLTVITPPAPVIISALNAGAVNRQRLTYQIAATSSPFSFSASGLPLGLRVNSTTGLISGVATVSGTSSVTISASNAGGTGSATLVLTVITPPPPAITSALTATAATAKHLPTRSPPPTTRPATGATGLPAGLKREQDNRPHQRRNHGHGHKAMSPSARPTPAARGSATLVLTVLPLSASHYERLTAHGAQTARPFSYQIAAANKSASYGAAACRPG